MINKRVYLAKSNLARGLDFEYVKSNLLRIPGIEIIEYGDGIQPSECACLIYVPEYHEMHETEFLLNKNITNTILNFCEAFNKSLENVFVYNYGAKTLIMADVEPTTPIISLVNEFYINNAESWDDYGFLGVEPTHTCMLNVFVSNEIQASSSWISNTRHHIPSEKFRLPPIPTVEQRRSRGTTRHLELSNEIYKTHYGAPTKVESVSQEPERERYSNAKSKRKERLL